MLSVLICPNGTITIDKLYEGFEQFLALELFLRFLLGKKQNLTPFNFLSKRRKN